MYKIYINTLLNALSNHAYALNINSLSLLSPSFANDISSLTIQPSFPRVLMQMFYCYSLRWRYEFNNSKSGVVTFGQTRVVHCDSMKKHEWILGGEIVYELYECKNLGVLKNYTGSFSSNVDDNIEKTRSKTGMIFSANLDPRKVNPLIFVKFWRQACFRHFCLVLSSLRSLWDYCQNLNAVSF